MATIYESILSAFQKDADGAAAVTAIAKKVIMRSYKSGDMLEVQLMLDNMTRNYRDVLPRFFKRAGFTVDVAPGKPAIVGLLDKSNQARVFEWLQKPDTVVVNPEDVIRKPKVAKADDRTNAEKADDAIKSLLARTKDDDVRGLINQRIQKPAPWIAKLAALNMDDSEVRAVVEYILECRLASQFEQKVA